MNENCNSKSFNWISYFLSYTFIFHKHSYFISSGLKIIGHGNTDSNLESHYLFFRSVQTGTGTLLVSDPVGTGSKAAGS
jgi:hypothetical protein